MIVENESVTIDLDPYRSTGVKDLKNLLCFRGERVRKITRLARLSATRGIHHNVKVNA